jgi:hypothetical protein
LNHGRSADASGTTPWGCSAPCCDACTGQYRSRSGAEGNPKNIKGAKDLGRDDLVESHPNPITEGIFKFYGSQMLKDLDLYEKVTGGKMCKGCWAVEGRTWFTERHHRETPYRIENGEADVGIIWVTEVKHAKAEGRAIDGVAIEAPYNMAEKVGDVIFRQSP